MALSLGWHIVIACFGIGFPAWTGGVIQYINQYSGGLQGFVDRARELASRYGSHFELHGRLAPVVGALLGARLQAGFAAMTAALVARAETLHAARSR